MKISLPRLLADRNFRSARHNENFNRNRDRSRNKNTDTDTGFRYVNHCFVHEAYQRTRPRKFGGIYKFTLKCTLKFLPFEICKLRTVNPRIRVAQWDVLIGASSTSFPTEEPLCNHSKNRDSVRVRLK